MIVPVIAAAALAAAGLFFELALVGYNYCGYCCFGLAAVILAYALLHRLKRRREKLSRALFWALNSVLIVGFTVFAGTEFFIIREAVTAGGDADTVVVLGAGVNGTVPSRTLWARLNAALSYAEENPAAVLVLSGGQGPGEDISEAECMRRWLTSRGVAEERLLLEDRSTNTEQNLRFTKELLDETFPDFDGKILIVTEGYHLLRARLLAQGDGFTDLSARAAYNGYPVLTANYYIREALGIWYYILKGRF